MLIIYFNFKQEALQKEKEKEKEALMNNSRAARKEDLDLIMKLKTF